MVIVNLDDRSIVIHGRESVWNGRCLRHLVKRKLQAACLRLALGARSFRAAFQGYNVF
jgi:hypothetical protein